jgi:transcriptional regulator with XRE-family HTH domain
MTPAQARTQFAKAVKSDGEALVAVKLRCSSSYVSYIVNGKRNPGLRIACAIEESYGIPMSAWVERPASRKIA